MINRKCLILGCFFWVLTFFVFGEPDQPETIVIPFYVKNGTLYSNLYSPAGRRLVCLWDTGSSVSLIHSRYLEAEVEGYHFKKDSLAKEKVDPLSFSSGTQSLPLSFVVADLDFLNKDSRTDAILGTDMMEDWTVQFDFPQRMVRLNRAPLRNPNFEFLWNNWLPYLPIEIQGRQEMALIDLGFNGEFLAREAVGLVPDEVKTYRGNSILAIRAQWDTTIVGRIDSLALLGELRANVPVLLLPDEADHYGILVGYEYFRRGVLTLDFPNGKGLWERREPPRKTLARLLPMNYSLVEADGAVHISNIEVGKDLGLFPGDTIVAVNGTAVEGAVDVVTSLLGDAPLPQLLILRDSEYLSVTLPQ